VGKDILKSSVVSTRLVTCKMMIYNYVLIARRSVLKIYNMRIVTDYARIGGAGSHQVARRSVLIVNELGYEMRL